MASKADASRYARRASNKVSQLFRQQTVAHMNPATRRESSFSGDDVRVRSGGTSRAQSAVENDIVYRSLMRELRTVKDRVDKVLHDFDFMNPQPEEGLSLGDTEGPLEESRMHISELMEQHEDLHMCLEEDLFIDEFTEEYHEQFRDSVDLSDERFMQAYNLTAEDLQKLKAISLDMQTLASHVRRGSLMARRLSRVAESVSPQPPSSRSDSRYDRMIDMFTEESIKSVKLSSDLEQIRKDMVRLKEENSSLTEQSEAEKQRAEDSTKKLLEAEKKLLRVSREIHYLTHLSKKEKRSRDLSHLAVPELQVSYTEKAPPPLLVPSGSQPDASGTSADEEEDTESPKFSVEEQLRRLELLLGKTDFIEKKPLAKNSPVTEQPSQAAKKLISKETTKVKTKKLTRATNGQVKIPPNREKKSTQHLKKSPLPFQSAAARMITPPPPRETLRCNVTTPIVPIPVQPTNRLSRIRRRPPDDHRESLQHKTGMVRAPSWIKQMSHITESSSQQANPKDRTDQDHKAHENGGVRRNLEKIAEENRRVESGKDGRKSNSIEYQKASRSKSKTQTSVPKAYVQPGSSYSWKGNEPSLQHFEKRNQEMVLAKLKEESPQKVGTEKVRPKDTRRQHKRFIRNTVLHFTSQQGVAQEPSVPHSTTTQEYSRQTKKLSKETGAVANYRMFRNWIFFNKVGTPPTLPDAIDTSQGNTQSHHRTRPLGQVSSKWLALKESSRAKRSPRISYSIRNFTPGVHPGGLAPRDTDEEFSRVPAENLYKTLVGL